MGHERGDYTTMNEEKKLNMPQSLLLLLLIIGQSQSASLAENRRPDDRPVSELDHHLFILQSIENQL